jgi:outer membrane protein assembly factor BamB
MIDFKKLFKTLFFVFKFIFLYFALFVLQITPQQKVRNLESKNGGSNKPVDLSIPFRNCFQKPDNNIVAVEFASDKTNAIFLPFQDGRIAKINLNDGYQVWVSNLGGDVSSRLIYYEGKVFLITKVVEDDFKKNKDDNKQLINYILWSLDAITGLTDWQLNFTSDSTVTLDIHQNKIFLITKNGTINSIKTSGAVEILNKNLAAIISSTPIFLADKIYIGTEDNSILIVSTGKTEIAAKISTIQSPVSALVAAEGKLFWGERKGFVNFFDTDTKSLIWSVRYGGEISSLTIVANGVLVTSFDNFVYFTSLQKGKQIWRRRLAGRILAKPLIVGNFAVIVTNVNNNAVILDLRDGKIVNQISLADLGFILSKPSVLENSLVFSTNKGIFSFVPTNIDCSQN